MPVSFGVQRVGSPSCEIHLGVDQRGMVKGMSSTKRSEHNTEYRSCSKGRSRGKGDSSDHQAYSIMMIREPGT